MPSHYVMPSVKAARRLAQKANRPIIPRDDLRNVQQRLDFRNTEWNDRRGWNDGPGVLPETHQANNSLPPAPPQNLDWNAPYQSNRPDAAYFLRHDEPPNMLSFLGLDDEPPRGPGPERIARNDFQRDMEPPVINRNYQNPNSQFRNFDMEPPMAMQENSAPMNSFTSSGYESFEGRRGYASFVESSHVNSPHEYEGERNQDRDQWRPYDQPGNVAKKRRREPSPRRPVGPRGSPEISDRVFYIGGFKLPYIFINEGLPQPEAKSYTVRFFKKNPNYTISLNKGKGQTSVGHIYMESGDVNDVEGNDMERTEFFSLYRFRDDIAKEWTQLYRGRFYRNWDGWWKDFHSINVDIDEQLKKFDGFNVKYNFMPQGRTFDFFEEIKKAHIALTKNRNNYLGNFRVIYGLMDPILVSNMPMEAVAQLQGIIREVPNHLWVYKLRCVVYIWYKYSQVMASKHTRDQQYQHILKEWSSPVIHWVAKQAFVELRNISQVEYPDYSKLYGKHKDVKD